MLRVEAGVVHCSRADSTGAARGEDEEVVRGPLWCPNLGRKCGEKASPSVRSSIQRLCTDNQVLIKSLAYFGRH